MVRGACDVRRRLYRRAGGLDSACTMRRKASRVPHYRRGPEAERSHCTPLRVQPSLIALNPTDRTEGPATAISTLHVSVYRIQLTGIQLFHVFGVNAVMFRLDRGPSPSALV